MGTGQDVKLMTSRGGRVVLNRGKVVSEVSKSLGEDVARQFDEQLGGIRGDDSRAFVSVREIRVGGRVYFDTMTQKYFRKWRYRRADHERP